MKRFPTRLKICHLIRLLTNQQDVGGFITLLAEELEFLNFQKLLVRLFLQERFTLDPAGQMIHFLDIGCGYVIKKKLRRWLVHGGS